MSKEWADELGRGVYPRLDKNEDEHIQLEHRVDSLESDVKVIKNHLGIKSKYSIAITSSIIGSLVTVAINHFI